MNPRLMVVCLGGLAGAGAVVCCDMDEGDEVLDALPEAEETVLAVEPVEAVAEAVVH